MEKEALPNATIVLVYGISSILLGCAFGGFPLGIAGIILSAKGRRLYKENPSRWRGYGTLKAGYIMSVIGIILGAFAVLGYAGGCGSVFTGLKLH